MCCDSRSGNMENVLSILAGKGLTYTHEDKTKVTKATAVGEDGPKDRVTE